MGVRRIRITDEEDERLKSHRKNEKMSYPDVIPGHYPKRRKLSEVFNEIGDCSELADTIEKVSKELRKARFGEFRT
jgi:predicted CopG family antitoxin